MTSIIRRGAFPTRTISKREFLTPFDELFNEFFNSSFPALHNELGNDFFAQGSYPKCNVVNFDDRIEIEAAIPGLTSEDIDVEVTEGVLTIRAESNQRIDVEDSQYVKREVKRSAFARSFRLGDNLDETKIGGLHENGILTITIPKIKSTNSEPVVRKIKIT
jgi:HSP20 family protein